MNRSSIRAFGIACFLIGVSLFIFDKFGNAKSKIVDGTQYEQKIANLEHQLKEANEQIALLEQAQQSPTTEDEESSNSEVEALEPLSNPEHEGQETSSDVVEATLHIYSGLTAYEIGKKLEDLGIVQNGLEMELFLAKPEYAKSIQIGQFELNSSMTIEEIAKIITGKK